MKRFVDYMKRIVFRDTKIKNNNYQIVKIIIMIMVMTYFYLFNRCFNVTPISNKTLHSVFLCSFQFVMSYLIAFRTIKVGSKLLCQQTQTNNQHYQLCNYHIR